MQGFKIFLLCLIIPHVAFAGNKWGVTLPGGNMRFQGVVMAESCRVEAGNKMMIVDMGKISSNHFKWFGQESNPITFDIHLQDCSTSVSQRVGISFQGVSDGKNPHVLSVDSGEGSAKGLSIALFDNDGQFIPLNSPPSIWKELYNGKTTLHFLAKYRATAKNVVGGKVNAQAWFSLTYL